METMTLARLTRRLADHLSGRRGALPASGQQEARPLATTRTPAAARPSPPAGADRTADAPLSPDPCPVVAERPIDALRGGLPPRRTAIAAQAADALSRAAAGQAFAIEHDEAPFPARVQACRRALAASRVAPLPQGSAQPDPLRSATGRDRSHDPAQAEALALVAVAAQRVLGLRPHLAQLTAAAIALDDDIAELPTGEGHLLSLVVAACVRAMAGEPVHLVLRHDGVVAEGHQRYRTLFEALGLRTARVTTDLAAAQREQAHRADVVFTSAAALLQDRGAGGERYAVPGFAGLRSAFLHEADRLLIDGARFRSSSPPLTLTLRELFRRYWRLGGVTATGREASDELAEVYGLAVVPVASIYPAFERDLGWRILPDRASQQRWLLDRVDALRKARRPVLILASSRDECRSLATLLLERGIEPVRCDQVAADPARAGTMAGLAGKARAVSLHCVLDPVPLTVLPEPMARAAGGLALIATALGPSRRHDRHNAGRVGHQGEPGTIEAILDAERPIVMAGWSLAVPGLVRLAGMGAPQHLLALAIAARRRQLDTRMRRLRRLGRDEPGPRGEAVAAIRDAALLPDVRHRTDLQPATDVGPADSPSMPGRSAAIRSPLPPPLPSPFPPPLPPPQP